MAKQYITAEKLAHGYGDAPLFSGLSFRLPAGHILQLMGKNGSGKTTLLHLLAGLKHPREGSISRDEETSLLYIGHQNALKLDLSPLENLLLYQPVANVCKKSLEALGLKPALHHQPCYTLSAGQQRKVALSRLMISDARVWIVDEPFTALDDSARARIIFCLEEHARQGGCAIVATHDSLDIAEPLLKRMSLS
ncbi:MAG: heme ABC exporter ATP-binding protein CcmA [Proteobacteria bacterium]|nr:heme ABC exporter ATP-binding protein CcmA [Pseudomonadota bacterium]